MPDTRFVFYIDDYGTVSWIDHEVNSFYIHELLSEMDALHNDLTANYFPESICVQIGANEKHPIGEVNEGKLITFHKDERYPIKVHTWPQLDNKDEKHHVQMHWHQNLQVMISKSDEESQ